MADKPSIRFTIGEGRRHRAGALLLLFSLLALASTAQAWELRICAEPNNMPFSNRAEEGFENRIARIIADQLGATLSYQWLPESRASDRLLYLRRGDCDVVVGVGDGTEGYLTTVAYYLSAPVFVYRQDAPFEVTSFDDEILNELRIAVLAGVGVRPEVAALANRNLMPNVVSFSWEAEGPTPLAAPVEAVASGEVDIAVLWGPVGSYFGERHEVPLEVVSAEPKLDLPFLNLVVPITMGVRHGDVALRDLLNHAIAASWDEIQVVLDQYEVPTEPNPAPATAVANAGPGLRVGFALPLPTGSIPLEPDAPHQAAVAAQMGALMAEEELGAQTESFSGLELLMSNTPSATSARRAAERMVANGAVALVGGYGPGQAEELEKVAAARQVPFLNIGPSSPESCAAYAFEIEADAGSYLSALVRALGAAGQQRLLVAYPDTADGTLLLEATRAAVDEHEGVSIVDEVPVSGEQQLIEVALTARERKAQAIVALLDWRAQLDLAGFMGLVGEGVVLTGYPFPVTQTRTFYYSLRNLGWAVSDVPRIALWDASLAEGPSGELNGAFFARWGEPMDPPAWAAYISLELIRQAGAGAETGEQLAKALEEVSLASGVGFGGQDHQLRQTLFQVRVDPTAESRQDSVTVVQRFEVDELPVAAGCR